MSWDLEVYVVRQPAPGSAAECARDCGLEVVGEGEDIEVTLPGGRDVFFVSEPLTFETDDAPDAVLDANVSAGWLVQLNVPASSDDTGSRLRSRWRAAWPSGGAVWSTTRSRTPSPASEDDGAGAQRSRTRLR